MKPSARDTPYGALISELREAEAYYSSASDPNLRQQSDLCKRAADALSAAQPSEREEKLEAALRHCLYFDNGLWLGGLREDADVTYLVGDILKEKS